jgi:hypothetical protein
VDFFQHRLTRQITADMMSEAQTIANKMGIQFRVMLEKRIAGDTRRRHPRANGTYLSPITLKSRV